MKIYEQNKRAFLKLFLNAYPKTITFMFNWGLNNSDNRCQELYTIVKVNTGNENLPLFESMNGS